MKAKKIWANLSVANVEKSREFYQKLGFKSNESHNSEELTSFLVGDDDFVIHFFEKERFKTSLEGEIADLTRGNEIMFTLSAESKDEVNKWVEQVKKVGGTIHFDPQKDHKDLYDKNEFYTCVFSDLDGHKFNVFFKEGMQ
jgi:hypothetical protein